MHKRIVLLCAAVIGLAACGSADTGGNATETGNDTAGGTIDGSGAPAADAKTAAGAGETVSFQGCPILRDIEGGCLVVESGGVTYDINSAQPRPDPAQRLIIQGTGTPGGVSVCMTGTVLTDIQWQYTKAKCSDEDKG